MGGKEGSRGYLYQGIVAVLEALLRDDWDQIFVEFLTEGDKVDIALKCADKVTDAIQVKSTVNSFTLGVYNECSPSKGTDAVQRFEAVGWT